MSFLETAKETIEMHANQLRYQAGSIGCFRTPDAEAASDLLYCASELMIRFIENESINNTDVMNKHNFIKRARAYLNELEENVLEASWSECIHLAGHVEQEMHELKEEIHASNN